MSRQLEFIRGKSVYTEFKEGEIKKITDKRARKSYILIEIDLEGTIIEEMAFYGRDYNKLIYVFPDKHKFLYELICFKENMPVPPICTPIECTLEDLKVLEGLKIPFLVSHRLTEKGEEVEYISLIEEVI